VRNDKDISLPRAESLLFASARYQAREIVAGLNFRQTLQGNDLNRSRLAGAVPFGIFCFCFPWQAIRLLSISAWRALA
jgi:hypothetical protein